MLRVACFILLGLVAVVVASRNLADELLASKYVPMERGGNGNRRLESGVLQVPSGWRKIHDSVRGRMTGTQRQIDDQMFHVSFALKNRNLDVLKKKFFSVSDPSNADHENYLTMQQVAELTTPSSEDKELVLNYVKSIPGAIIVRVSKHENFVSALLPVRSINKYFRSEMKSFLHESTGTVLLRSEVGYALPEKISQAVNLITGLVGFPSLKKQKKARSSNKARYPFPEVNPRVISMRYNITYEDNSTIPSGSQAVASFLGEFFNFSDLATFQETFGLQKLVPKVMGPNDEEDAGDEATLDIQYVSFNSDRMH